MINKIIMTAMAAAVVASASPVHANPFAEPHDYAPRGASATLNLKIPFGPKSQATKAASYGLTFNYGRAAGSPYLDARPVTQTLTLGDLRFNSDGLAKARVASFDFAQDGVLGDQGRRANLFDGPLGLPEYAIIGGAVVLVALLAF